MIEFLDNGFLSDGAQLGFSRNAFHFFTPEIRVVNAQEPCVMRISGGTQGASYVITINCGTLTASQTVKKTAGYNTVYFDATDIFKSGIERLKTLTVGQRCAKSVTAASIEVTTLDTNGEEVGTETWQTLSVYDSLYGEQGIVRMSVSSMMPDTIVIPRSNILANVATFGFKMTDCNIVSWVGISGTELYRYAVNDWIYTRGTGDSILGKIIGVGYEETLYVVAKLADDEIMRSKIDYEELCHNKVLVRWWSPVDGCYKSRVAVIAETSQDVDMYGVVRGFEQSAVKNTGADALLRFANLTTRDYMYYRDIAASDEVTLYVRNDTTRENYDAIAVSVNAATESKRLDCANTDFDFSVTIKRTNTL